MEAARDDYEPQADDGELITRGEHRRMINVFVKRFEKLESLCFEDTFEPDGVTVKRPSLEHLLESAHKHISVLCAYARGFKWMIAGLASIAAAAAGVIEVLRAVGAL